MSINLVPRLNCAISRRFFSRTYPLHDIFTIQDEDDFKAKVIESKKPVVVDFFATWCGPCKMLTPRLEVALGGKGDKIDLAKVDVDNQENLAAQYKVSSVPTVFAVKNGKVIDTFVGNKDDDELRAFVEKILD
ncbi:thioredoxin, mitochondrial-like [Brevipalpus obovatus]|uniref:thioredoxin, mitochondrial-like n=1 Tax=Brevipalpus obovatus TaxID=246614 RepID=UPI003D9DDD5E